MKFKKLLTLALAAAAACGISVSAAASTSDTSEDGVAVLTESVSRKCLALGGKFIQNGLMFTELEDGTYEVGYDYNGSKPSGAVVIPETANGKPVTRIAEAGFYDCGDLVSVTVPDSVIGAGANAFTGTPFLNDQSGSIKYAGKVAVYCDSSAKNAVIKEGTLGLADRLFCLAKELKTASLPESLINIGTMTFDGCSALTSVNIPGKLTTIGSGVFFGCTALTAADIPESVTAIGSYAFAESGITYADLMNVVKIGKSAFENSKLGVNNVRLGSGCVDIGARAFEGTMFYEVLGSEKYAGTVFLGCVKDAESVTIREGTTAVADMAFSSCKKLKSVTIPASVKTIGKDAFFNCPLLASAAIPEGVESIGEDAFRLCGGLESVSLPISVKTIGQGAFYGCGNIKTVTYPGSVVDWGKIVTGDDSSLPSALPKFGKNPARPDPITGLKVTQTTENSVTLTWDKHSLATSYQVDVYKNDKWVSVGKVGGGTCSFTVKGLSQYTGYDFRVFAYIHNVYSSSVAASAQTKIASVTGVDTSPSSNEITLSWNKNNTADCYQVDMYKGGKWVRAAKTSSSEINTCKVTGLSPKTEYKFKIYTFKGSDYSAPVNVTATTAAEPEKPAAVTGLSAAPGGNYITLSWNPNPNAESYQVDVYKNGKWTYVTKTTGTSHRVTGLSANTSYELRVFAFKNGKYSDSAKITASTRSGAAASGKPAAVTGLSAVSGGNNITLSWNKSSNADSYQVDVYKNGKWTYVAKTTGTSCKATGLSANTSYDFRVFAFKGSEYSSSAKITASTKSGAAASGKPAAVTGLSAASGGNNITLSWNKSSNADSYQIDVYKNGKWTYVAKITGTSYNVTGLSANTTYDFRVFAFKGSSYSSSAKISASTAASGKPAAVTGLSAVPSSGSIALSWNKSPNADRYQVDMYKNGVWVYVAKTTGTSCNVTGLSANTSYNFRVFAFKGSSYSSSAKISASTTASSGKPAAVTGLSAVSDGSSKITLSWNKSANADSYQIDMYRNGKWVYVAKITGTSYNVTGLSANTSYDFRVFAFNGSSYSSSAKISASTRTVLAPPQNAPAALSEVNTKLKGIDVSGWQGVIDFNVVKEIGVDFVIVKAGESDFTVDTWETNYANAKKAGLMVGAYWYSHATTVEESKKEAKAFIAALKGKQLDFPVYFDLEEPDQFNTGKDNCTKITDAFCGELEKAGYCAGVYCSTFWYTNYVNDSVRLKRPAWIADYRAYCHYDAAYGMWQYGIGRVDGVENDCDLNWGYIDYSKYIKANKLNGYR